MAGAAGTLQPWRLGQGSGLAEAQDAGSMEVLGKERLTLEGIQEQMAQEEIPLGLRICRDAPAQSSSQDNRRRWLAWGQGRWKQGSD